MNSLKKNKNKDLYGILASLGYNGEQKNEQGRHRALYHVRKRKIANGIKPHREVDLTSEAAAKMDDKEYYSVVFSNEDGFGTMIGFKKDNKTDLFQLGRSTEPNIDFTVVDTVPGPKDDIERMLTNSTISRFACRFLIDRSPPNRARVFAAGFNSHKQIFLGPNAPQWSNARRYSDGLTTNGILVYHPKGQWGNEMSPGVWREVSVSGEMFGLRSCRSARNRGKTTDCSNILRDGTLLDLCGVVLLWRTPEGMAKAPTYEDLLAKRDLINALKAQCPIGFITLRFTNTKDKTNETVPYIYTSCGHVHGYHVWGARPVVGASENSDRRTCPFCKEDGRYVPLQFGLEPMFYIDNETPTHCFVPCGHMTTEATVKYWSRVLIPHGKDKFHRICPFCAIPLEGDAGYVKLIFQTQADEKEIHV